MKLYTEEQMIQSYDAGFQDFKEGLIGRSYHVLENITPIELPIDEQIEESETNSPYDRIDEYNYGFIDGANWVKQFILKQNK